MLKRLLASLFIATIIAPAFYGVASAQGSGPTLKQYLRRKMNRGIDDGMVRPAPRTGDTKIARKAPENIDDGIFTPRRVFRTYKRAARPKLERK